MQALVIMSLLAQLDVFQPKFFLSLSHRKARLPGDKARVPNKMRSRENSLWSRCIRRNPVLVIHRIFTSYSRQTIVNNSVNQSPPGPPSAGVRPYSTAGGRVLGSTQPAPLLVLARFQAKNQLTKNKSHRVTPFWHNDTRSRVTVTFGARRMRSLH